MFGYLVGGVVFRSWLAVVYPGKRGYTYNYIVYLNYYIPNECDKMPLELLRYRLYLLLYDGCCLLTLVFVWILLN